MAEWLEVGANDRVIGIASAGEPFTGARRLRMEIIKLPLGEMAPADTDCIKINQTAGGDFTLVASALATCGDGDDAESVALVGSDPYPSYDEAEAAGLAWAEAHCVVTIHIETGGGPEPTMPHSRN